MNTINIKLIISSIGGIFGCFLGEMDGLLYGLVTFTVIDYITGVMCAIDQRKLSSSVGFKGIARKIIIFTIKSEKNLENVLFIFSYCYHIVFIL